MSTGAITVIKPGAVLPDAYRTKVLEKYGNGLSLITQGTREGLSTIRLESDVKFEPTLKEAEDKFKDRWLICYHTDEENQTGEEYQPFPLIVDAEGKPLLVACVEGSFEKYAGEQETVCPEAAFVEKWFGDAVFRLYEANGQDIKKLLNALDNQDFRKECQAHFGSRGVVVVMTNEGAPLWISKANGLFGSYSWGEVSNNLGYSEPKATPAPATEGEVVLSKMTYSQRKVFQAMQKAGKPITPEPAKSTPDATKKEEPKSAVPQVTKSGEVRTDGGNILFKGDKRFLFPPDTLTDHTELRKFYGRHGRGHKNYDWKARVGIPVDHIIKSSHFWSVINASRENKDTDAHHVQPASEQVSAKLLPVIAPDQVAQTVALLKQNVMSTEAELNKTAEDFPLFSQRMNTTLDNPAVALMPFDKMCELGHKALACLAHEFRMAYLKAHPNILKDAFKAPAKEEEEEPDVSKMSYSQRKAYLAKQKAAA